ncbi:protein of unknown function [Candidatus Nitrosocosmicus franklandus]|uniref:Uncharacterized protein n=1 Tax=Candidatus Nitrosocosmicus franklandianus TaxID=1798806 RepID=A0A484IBZ4_9ARCH|nr:protein of unknown function [Candidatus Nitrosocosmicus franklandus]
MSDWISSKKAPSYKYKNIYQGARVIEQVFLYLFVLTIRLWT